MHNAEETEPVTICYEQITYNFRKRN